MKPLELNRQFLTWVSIYPPDANTGPGMRFMYLVFTVIVLIGDFVGFFAGLTFLLSTISTDLEKATYSLCQVTGMVNMTYILVVSLYLRRKITSMVDNLIKFYDEYTDDDSAHFLSEANYQSDLVCKLYFVLAIGGIFVGTYMMSATSVLVQWKSGRSFDGKHQFLLFEIIVPWNQFTPFGYFAEISFDIYSFEAYYISGSLLVLFISLCLHHNAFYKIFDNKLRKFEHSGGNVESKRHISEIIHFHNTTRDLFSESADIFGQFIFVFMMCTIIVTAAFLFHLDLQFRHANIGIILIVGALLSDSVPPFLYCFFGKMATDSHTEMSNSLFGANWYELPIDLQKCVVVMIQVSQQEIHYHGFGVILLNLETFTSLTNTVISYFMIFKTVTN